MNNLIYILLGDLLSIHSLGGPAQDCPLELLFVYLVGYNLCRWFLIHSTAVRVS